MLGLNRNVLSYSSYGRTSCSNIVQRSTKIRLLSNVKVDEYVIFPNERAGVDYDTNWAVASAGLKLSRNQKAFRNPCFDTGIKYLNKNDSLDEKNKTINRITEATSVFKPPALDLDSFDDIALDARNTVNNSKSEALFVIDGGVSSSGSTNVNIRAVTDDAGTALLIKSILCGVPKQKANKFVPQVQVVHSSTADKAAEGKAYVAAHGTQVAARGVVEASAFIGALASAAATANEGHSLVLEGSVYMDKDNTTVLMLGENVPPKGQVPAAAHHFVWGEKGVSRAWNFGVLPADQAPEESIIGSSNFAVAPNFHKSMPSILPHPSKVIFKGVEKKVTSVEEACELLASVGSTVGGSEKESEVFTALIKASGATVGC